MNRTRRAPFATPSLGPRVVSKTLKYRLDQEHLLRRIASALVLHWDELPEQLQDLIIDQASQVEDREAAAHDTTDLEAFVRGVKAIALSKAPAQTTA